MATVLLYSMVLLMFGGMQWDRSKSDTVETKEDCYKTPSPTPLQTISSTQNTNTGSNPTQLD